MQRIDRILQARNLRPYKGPWRVKRVAFGAADYGHELASDRRLDEPELADARARVVLASRAAGFEGPIDSPWFHFRRPRASRARSSAAGAAASRDGCACTRTSSRR